MADYIKVSTQRIRGDRELIQREMEGITASVEELIRGMQSLGGTWEGPAWQTFQNQVASDAERMKEICVQIGGYLQHIEYAENEYKKCENTVEQLISSIRI